ncbi:MAG TPA: hypothetical protein DD473_24660 [Planctomycetaceae bacterium]|nr:hypothetical protein [Planctomycetaceae bacterium]
MCRCGKVSTSHLSLTEILDVPPEFGQIAGSEIIQSSVPTLSLYESPLNELLTPPPKEETC